MMSTHQLQFAVLLWLSSRAVAKPVHASSYDVPLTWTPAGFTGAISVGTPPQQLRAFFDWTWISQYVFTTVCYDQKNTPYVCLNKEQAYFNESLSRTFRYVPEQYPTRTWNPNHFFFYNDLKVNYATDIVAVGPSTTFVVLQGSDINFNMTAMSFPFAGVYGLSPVFPSDNASTSSPFYQGWKQGVWRAPQVAFHYCYNESPDGATKASCGGANATQTLGGFNKDLVKDQKIWWYPSKVFPDVNTRDFVYKPGLYNYWGLELSALKIGNETQPIASTPGDRGGGAGPAAIFDHASYGRGTPLSPNAYRKLVAETGAKGPIELNNPPNNGNQSFYAVDCDKRDTFPTISYQFRGGGGGGKEWHVTPLHYVEKVNDTCCVLNVRTLADGDQFIGNFGETFSKDKYIIFDYEKLRVGIADLKW
ncbi:eukaryotic aspartyl protease [Xylariaceae sp. FL0594]|nr:eukaryotic aspartyl protease [Xylariaceae sp. FL0594]